MKRILLFVLFISIFGLSQAAERSSLARLCDCFRSRRAQVQPIPAGMAAPAVMPAPAAQGVGVPAAPVVHNPMPARAAQPNPIYAGPGMPAGVVPAVRGAAQAAAHPAAPRGYARASEVPLPPHIANVYVQREAEARAFNALRDQMNQAIYNQMVILQSVTQLHQQMLVGQGPMAAAEPAMPHSHPNLSTPSRLRDSARKRQFQAAAARNEAESPRLVKPTSPGTNTPVNGNSPSSVRERPVPVVYHAAAGAGAGAGPGNVSPQIGGRSLVDSMRNNPNLVITGNNEVNFTIHNFVPADAHGYPTSLEHMVELVMDDEENQQRQERESQRLAQAAARVNTVLAQRGAGPGAGRRNSSSPESDRRVELAPVSLHAQAGAGPTSLEELQRASAGSIPAKKAKERVVVQEGA